MRSIATLLVDDEPDIRMLMRLTLDQANEGLWVCGEASDGDEAVGMAADVAPDVIVVDQRMPGMTGIETAVALRARDAGARIVLCSAFLDTELREEGERAGISGFVNKRDIGQLPDVIRAVAAN
ncbi:MAG: response regulator transcription factor [Acidimicrobiia bacterium]|jgi:DNA-binding NarL/FixJ family response regulator